MPRHEDPNIYTFIMAHVENHADDIVHKVIEEYKVSKPTALRYIGNLVSKGELQVEGKARATRYKKIQKGDICEILPITSDLSEDYLWRKHFQSVSQGFPENIRNICQYGFTEMVNNILDHSQGTEMVLMYSRREDSVEFIVKDNGVGIFRKIQRDFNLPDPQMALLELSKGKLTSDSTRHSGEGIFFASRMFDSFMISSYDLFYIRSRQEGDDGWLIESEATDEEVQGTAVKMQVSLTSKRTMAEIFAEYQDDEFRFAKTHVTIALGKYPGEFLVSRSQAKRVMARVDKFTEVILDFQGVDQIGQAFADEIFRVYKNLNPRIHIDYIHAQPAVKQMISHVTKA